MYEYLSRVTARSGERANEKSIELRLEGACNEINRPRVPTPDIPREPGHFAALASSGPWVQGMSGNGKVEKFSFPTLSPRCSWLS